MNQNNKNLIKYIAQLVFAIFVFVSFTQSALAASPDKLVRNVNTSRQEYGLSSLTINDKLTQAAQAKAKDMFENKYFAHISPDGKTPWDFMKETNYDYIYAGENLAIGYTDDAELHQAWMNSSSHRENILNPNFTQIGMAVLDGVYHGAKTTIVVQMFGSPAVSGAQVLSAQNQSLNADQSAANPSANTQISVSPQALVKTDNFGDQNKTGKNIALMTIGLVLISTVLLAITILAKRWPYHRQTV